MKYFHYVSEGVYIAMNFATFLSDLGDISAHRGCLARLCGMQAYEQLTLGPDGCLHHTRLDT